MKYICSGPIILRMFSALSTSPLSKARSAFATAILVEINPVVILIINIFLHNHKLALRKKC